MWGHSDGSSWVWKLQTDGVLEVDGFGSSETEGDLLPSEPRWALHMCDNKCRAKGFKFFEMAVIVTEEGSAAHTINLCKTCDNAGRLKQGEEEVTAPKWRELVEQKAFG